MKRFCLFLLLLSLNLCMMAVPVLRMRRSVTLDDGRTMMVTACGDEDFNYFLTDDGQVVLLQDNTFHCTGLSLEEYVATLPSLPLHARQRVGSVASALVKPQGVKKIPIILTAFKDKQFTLASSDKRVAEYYEDFFNGEDITESTGNWGSVRQYFIDQSLGQFMPEFTVIGPIQLDGNYGYYGGDKGSSRDEDLKSYIGVIAKRRAIDAYRRLASSSGRSVSIDDEDNFHEIASDTDIQKKAEISDRNSILINKVKELGEPDSTIIIQQYYYNRTASEIAKAISMTAAAVQKRSVRARSKLKELLLEAGVSL